MINKGRLLLIPCPVSEGKIESLSTETIRTLHQTTHFIVERAKTARHFIKSAGHPVSISQLKIHEICDNKVENDTFLKNMFDGHDIGVISEAGCPGVADPGAEMVAWAHQNGIKVIPLIGPSSILLAVMASGFSGQSFAFNGYLSNKRPELIQQLKQLEIKVKKSGQTQIFMETPYRNSFVIETCLQSLEGNTKFCIACDINSETEDIKTLTIHQWKKEITTDYHKRPCIFLIGN
jgi:16S rRNA (cytidine1402-2'-O)-methyltransferase